MHRAGDQRGVGRRRIGQRGAGGVADAAVGDDGRVGERVAVLPVGAGGDAVIQRGADARLRDARARGAENEVARSSANRGTARDGKGHEESRRRCMRPGPVIEVPMFMSKPPRRPSGHRPHSLYSRRSQAPRSARRSCKLYGAHMTIMPVNQDKGVAHEKALCRSHSPLLPVGAALITASVFPASPVSDARLQR